MKTLKKNLCLVLAMVMVFGLCTISASAKLEYADNDAITYEEAVDVLSGLGILKGSASGFRPTASITRAEAAKILAYIMIGNATQADALKASTDPFTDVPASHWASGYISYCNSRGIILGVGDGSYRPNSNVTNIQFALMLLRALGYGTQNEYSGSDWPVKVASDAIRLGVFDDNLAGANSNAATREACALYAFNVIAKERDGAYGLKKVTYSALAGDYVASGAFGSLGTNVDANKKGTFGADFKLACAPADEDAFGRETGHYWYIDEGQRAPITANYEDSKLKAVYTTAVTGKDIYNLLGKEAIDKIYTTAASVVEVYVDGVLVNTPNSDSDSKTLDLNDAASYGKNKVDNLEYTGNGVETYVYQWWTDDGAKSYVKVCIVNTYLAKVNEVKAATSKNDRQITLAYVDDTVRSSFSHDNAKTYTTDDFAKGDYVLVNVAKPTNGANASVETVVPAVVLKTEVSRVTRSNDTVTIVADGTTYASAKVRARNVSDKIYKADKDGIDNTMVDGKNHTIYVDNHGYMISVADITASSEYVFVAQFGLKTNSTDELTDKPVFQADIYYADGSHKIVPIDNEHKNDGSGDTTSTALDNYFADSSNLTSVTATNVDGLNTTDYKTASSKLGLYKLDMYKGKAILTRVDEADSAASKTITKGINNTFGGSDKMDGDTVFFYVSGDYGKSSWSVSAYTGINNVPAGEAGKTDALQTIITSNKVKAVSVKNLIKGEDGTVIYLYLGTSKDYDKEDASVTYKLYRNGELDPQTITYKDVEAADDAIAACQSGFVYIAGDGTLKRADLTTSKPYAEVNKVYYACGSGGVTYSGDATTMTFTNTDEVILGVGNAKIVDLADTEIGSTQGMCDHADNATMKVAVEFTGGDNGAATIIYILGTSFTA